MKKTKAKGIDRIQQLAEAQAENMFNILMQIAQSSGDERARVAAADAVLSRAYGLPLSTLHLSGPYAAPISVVNPRRLSDEDLRKIAMYNGWAGAEDEADTPAD